MKLAQYLVDWFDAGEKIFAAGERYVLDELTRLHIIHGHAVEVDAEPEKAEADEAADKPKAKAKKAE